MGAPQCHQEDKCLYFCFIIKTCLSFHSHFIVKKMILRCQSLQDRGITKQQNQDEILLKAPFQNYHWTLLLTLLYMFWSHGYMQFQSWKKIQPLILGGHVPSKSKTSVTKEKRQFICGMKLSISLTIIINLKC